jgi:hypothetical protein
MGIKQSVLIPALFLSGEIRRWSLQRPEMVFHQAALWDLNFQEWANPELHLCDEQGGRHNESWRPPVELQGVILAVFQFGEVVAASIRPEHNASGSTHTIKRKE